MKKEAKCVWFRAHCSPFEHGDDWVLYRVLAPIRCGGHLEPELVLSRFMLVDA